jgi:hypothetical protein
LNWLDIGPDERVEPRIKTKSRLYGRQEGRKSQEGNGQANCLEELPGAVTMISVRPVLFFPSSLLPAFLIKNLPRFLLKSSNPLKSKIVEP